MWIVLYLVLVLVSLSAGAWFMWVWIARKYKESSYTGPPEGPLALPRGDAQIIDATARFKSRRIA